MQQINVRFVSYASYLSMYFSSYQKDIMKLDDYQAADCKTIC